MIAAARVTSGKSSRKVATALGVSAPYFGHVEKGIQRLAPSRWRALSDALPTLDLRAFVAASLMAGPVTFDARVLPIADRRAMADVLLATVAAMSDAPENARGESVVSETSQMSRKAIEGAIESVRSNRNAQALLILESELDRLGGVK